MHSLVFTPIHHCTQAEVEILQSLLTQVLWRNRTACHQCTDETLPQNAFQYRILETRQCPPVQGSQGQNPISQCYPLDISLQVGAEPQ